LLHRRLHAAALAGGAQTSPRSLPALSALRQRALNGLIRRAEFIDADVNVSLRRFASRSPVDATC
jgi:hypothetical protein